MAVTSRSSCLGERLINRGMGTINRIFKIIQVFEYEFSFFLGGVPKLIMIKWNNSMYTTVL